MLCAQSKFCGDSGLKGHIWDKENTGFPAIKVNSYESFGQGGKSKEAITSRHIFLMDAQNNSR